MNQFGYTLVILSAVALSHVERARADDPNFQPSGEQLRELRYSNQKPKPAPPTLQPEVSIYFTMASSAVDSEEQTKLSHFLDKWLPRCSDEIAITAYTDTTGSTAINHRLAGSRAQSVESAIVRSANGRKLVFQAFAMGEVPASRMANARRVDVAFKHCAED